MKITQINAILANPNISKSKKKEVIKAIRNNPIARKYVLKGAIVRNDLTLATHYLSLEGRLGIWKFIM